MATSESDSSYAKKLTLLLELYVRIASNLAIPSGNLLKRISLTFAFCCLVPRSQHLSSAKFDGILVHPSFSDVNDNIDGTLIVHSGYWTGAKIHFTLTLPYSSSGASLRVNTQNIFHPLVSPQNGSISQLHSQQTVETNSKLVPLVYTLHRIFNAPLAQSIGSAHEVLNQEAAQLFQDDKEAFAKRIKEILKSIDQTVTPSPYSVSMPETWTSEHEELLYKLKASTTPKRESETDQQSRPEESALPASS